MRLSIILPIYNEVGSIEELYREIKEVVDRLGISYEMIAINDGSTDRSYEIIEKIAKSDKNFKVISFSKNYGQTAAISAGLDVAQGEILMPMDSDLQNNPYDIPNFLRLINEGYDVVSGWRKDRKDSLLRRLPSQIANRLISYITNIRIHDFGCMMKAYRREVIKDTHFYGEMHRFMPVLVGWHGAKITEIVVNHRPRKYDKSKYGISRTFRVILDLLTVKFLMAYLTKPMHFFGWAGLYSFFFASISGLVAIILRLVNDVHFNRTPLPLLTVFLIMMGVQFILMGILAEILVRIYHEPQGKATYSVRSKINFEHE